MLYQFWPIYVESLWLIFKKNESVWPRKTESDWFKFIHGIVIESSWLEKSIYQPIAQNWIRPTQIRRWLSFWVNGLRNWVTRNNAIFALIWLNYWLMVEFESIWLSFSRSNWLVFLKNESKWLVVYGSKLGQHDSIFESLWLGKNS